MADDRTGLDETWFDETWFDEIDLDPDHSSRTMGTRALGDGPWLIVDSRRDEELALKAALCETRHDEVFVALPGTEAAGAEVAALVGAPPTTGHDLHPLDRAGRSVQEDLCLLRRHDDGWHLEAASVCFPSRWRLADKIGRHITEVHGPVDGYAPLLAPRVDRLFDRLAERPVWRRNWFVHPDASLFQPTDPPDGDPVVPARAALASLVIRSERQTLRRLSGDHDGGVWLLFTIRVQQASLARFCAGGARRAALDRYLRESDPTVLAHRALSPAQVTELVAALAGVGGATSRRDPGRSEGRSSSPVIGARRRPRRSW